MSGHYECGISAYNCMDPRYNYAAMPTGQPSGQPTKLPTEQPTRHHAAIPTGQPSKQPTSEPSKYTWHPRQEVGLL